MAAAARLTPQNCSSKSKVKENFITRHLSTLQEYGIDLDEDEINDVMMTMDGDGNGEVDFEEFLSLMTDTEMFIEALALKVKILNESCNSR